MKPTLYLLGSMYRKYRRLIFIVVEKSITGENRC